MSLVQAQDLDYGYGRKRVISGLELSLEPGEGPLGLCGANGSGKSSFIKACLGLARIQGGRLRVLGRGPGSPFFSASLKGLAYIPQQGGARAFRISLGELASSGREAMRGIGRRLTALDRSLIRESMERTGIAELAKRPVQELSGGEYQRGLLARALAMDPQLYFFDEPTTHLDKESRRDILRLIASLAAEGRKGLLIVSHDPGLLKLCRRLYVFESGRARLVPEAERAAWVDEERDA